MFGLGFGEIILILIVILLVFGPERLPEIARTLGRTTAELRRTMDEVKHELTAPRNELGHELENLKNEVIHRDQNTPRPLDGTCEQGKALADTLPSSPETAAEAPALAQPGKDESNTQ